MVMPAFGPAITQAGPPARLVRGVVLEVALGGGPPADGAGAGGVPDLGQVPQLHAGRSVPPGRGEAEPGPARRRSGTGACPVAPGFRAGAAVADGVAVLVGH